MREIVNASASSVTVANMKSSQDIAMVEKSKIDIIIAKVIREFEK